LPNQNRAVFLDRDGVVNELVYYPEMGVIDSPFTVDLFHILPGVGDAIRLLKQAGFKVAITSNQPGVAKGRFAEETLKEIDRRMTEELDRHGACLDGIYYCPHHPEGVIERYRSECECRKPKPGLLLQAARELAIDLENSYMIGDSLIDIKAGERAGCRTILIGRLKCDTCRLMDEQESRPDIIAPDLWTAAQVILDHKSLPDGTGRQSDLRKVIRSRLLESAHVKELVSEACADSILQAASIIADSFKRGGKVVLFGNGGSAADAQHIAGELVGRFLLERQALPAIALTTNTSILTALGNDYGYSATFCRQVEALVNSGDVVIGISTSGNSPNVIEALKLAREKGAKAVALTGSGGRLTDVADLTLAVPSKVTPRIQEAHITIGHIICEIVESELADGKRG
jgi:D-sedoheptulose 7-phosphate isomerase